MGFTNDIKNIKGVVTVQIEGFFTERFINLCKINNIKIWDIRNIVKGVVRFKINVSDFKKLKSVAKKTKCKVEIKEKKGLYFTLFKYRKRKIVILLVAMLIFFSIAFSTFIWKIDITGNENISTDKILQGLKDSGIYIGKNKIGLDKKEIVNSLRVQIQDVSWAGIEIDGTTAMIKIVEKTKLADKDIQHTEIGDIIASKSGIITKIVPENGTSKYVQGSYIEKGNIAIEGTIYSKFIDPVHVPAKGILKVECTYELKKEYKYENIRKDYTGKKRYTIGLGVNSKENMLNYLNKSKKYDITKSSKIFNLFGNEFSLDLYNCVEYVENYETKSKDELIEKSKIDSKEYLDNEILPNTINGSLVDSITDIQETQDGIIVTTSYIISEEVGQFVKR